MRIEQLTGQITQTIKAKPPASASGLAAHWNFDQSAADRKILDVSGNQNHATFAGIGDTVDHHKGKAFRFDGSSSVLSIANLRGVDFSTGDFTITLWIKINPIVKGAPTILSLGGEASTYPGVIFQYRMLDNGNGRFETYLARQGQAGYIHSTGHPPNLNDDKWHHLALSVNRSGQVATYIDGHAVFHQDIAKHKSAPLAGRGGLRIGQYQSLPPAMPMLVDDIRIYNKPLTADQVLQVIDQAGEPTLP